jgi:hypothetical protein
MATQYSDLFTYGTFVGIQDWRSVCYSNVVLLKDLCGKKAGATVDKIILDTTTGKFTVPRSTRTSTAMETAAKTLVEFKGVHTRFPDSDDESPPKPSKKKKATTAIEKGETSTRPNNISVMMGLKIYENKRRKLVRVESVDDFISREIHNQLRKEMHAVTSDMSMGSRGELTFTFQTSSMEYIPEMKTLTEFIVIGCTYYYSRVV